MADYAQEGNRWTAIFVIQSDHNGRKVYKRAPFDLVRFNVDTNPDAEPEIVPLGELEQSKISPVAPDTEKLYEKIWVVESLPYSSSKTGKHDFGTHFD